MQGYGYGYCYSTKQSVKVQKLSSTGNLSFYTLTAEAWSIYMHRDQQSRRYQPTFFIKLELLTLRIKNLKPKISLFAHH